MSLFDHGCLRCLSMGGDRKTCRSMSFHVGQRLFPFIVGCNPNTAASANRLLFFIFIRSHATLLVGLHSLLTRFERQRLSLDEPVAIVDHQTLLESLA